MTRRVVAYIDGFNLYHSIDKNLESGYKWVDYAKLMRSFLKKNEELKQVYLFTAYPLWNPEKMRRHQQYCQVLSEMCGVNIILGTYKQKTISFDSSRHQIIRPPASKISPPQFEFKTYEEKETDVNLALHILRGALRDEYDTCFIVTADSDISPAISMVRQLTSQKEMKFIFPYKSYGATNHHATGSIHTIGKRRLYDALLPRDCPVSTGIISCPYPFPPLQPAHT